MTDSGPEPGSFTMPAIMLPPLTIGPNTDVHALSYAVSLVSGLVAAHVAHDDDALTGLANAPERATRESLERLFVHLAGVLAAADAFEVLGLDVTNADLTAETSGDIAAYVYGRLSELADDVGRFSQAAVDHVAEGERRAAGRAADYLRPRAEGGE